MALTLTQHLFKVQNAAKEKLSATAQDILALLTGATIAQRYEGEDGVNRFTDAHKTKLEGLDPNHYKGKFTSVAALNAITGIGGDYADVDAGAGSDVQQYIWDTDDAKWVVQAGATTAETSASIKTKYEANPNTNSFTDTAKEKVDRISVSQNVDLDAMAASSHAAVTLAPNTGMTIAGQQITNDYSTLPAV